MAGKRGATRGANHERHHRFCAEQSPGRGGIAVVILAVLFFLKRFSRSGTVAMSDPGRAGRGGAKAQKKARGGWFASWDTLIDPPSEGNLEEMEALLDKGRDINFKDESGVTPLLAAAMADEVEAVKFLVDRGADIGARDDDGFTALLHAAESGHKEIVKYLLDRGADEELRTDGQGWPLMIVAEYGSLEVADMFLQRGASVNMRDDTGETALFAAVFNDSPIRMMEFLIENGGDPNAQDYHGCSVLMRAAWGGREKPVETLLKFNADPSMKDEDGKTALHFVREREPINEIIVGMLEKATAN